MNDGRVIPTCGRWSECGVWGGGCCAAGRFGGHPSLGTCNTCDLNPGRGRDLGLGNGVVQVRLPTAEERAKAEEDRNKITRALWRELHATALAGNLTPEWLDAFAPRVPCGECRRHWGELLKEFPPVLGDVAFAWTVEAHNRVNRRLGKPEMSIDEAAALYRDASVAG